MTVSSAAVEKAVEDAIAALKTPSAAAALPQIDLALAQAPNEPRLWHLKGLIHRADERRELAVPALRRAAELAPNSALVAHGLARTLLEAGLPSVDEFARAIRLAPADRGILTGMVAALVSARRTSDAIAGLTRFLAAVPTWTEGHELLSDLRWTEGERAGFTRSFDDALAAQPANLELRRQQLSKLLHAEQHEAVLAKIAEGRRILGHNPVFSAYEAFVESDRGNIARADALFTSLADLPDSSVQIRRVRHLLRSDRAAEASRKIEPWLETDDAYAFWPYASIAWRLTGDPRWGWLEGDERFVGVYDIADRLPPLDRVTETLRALHTTSGQPLVQSVRGGTQTDGHLFQHIDPTIIALREAIRTAVTEHAANLPARDEKHPLLGPPRSPILFSGAWSVRLRAGGFHANHVHPMGWISSALYIVLPPDLGRDEAGVLTLGEPQSPSFPVELPPVRTVEPKVGRLALFPSWMWHGTRPFGEGERITVAFDVARGGRSPQ